MRQPHRNRKSAEQKGIELCLNCIKAFCKDGSCDEYEKLQKYINKHKRRYSSNKAYFKEYREKNKERLNFLQREWYREKFGYYERREGVKV